MANDRTDQLIQQIMEATQEEIESIRCPKCAGSLVISYIPVNYREMALNAMCVECLSGFTLDGGRIIPKWVADRKMPTTIGDWSLYQERLRKMLQTPDSNEPGKSGAS